MTSRPDRRISWGVTAGVVGLVLVLGVVLGGVALARRGPRTGPAASGAAVPATTEAPDPAIPTTLPSTTTTTSPLPSQRVAQAVGITALTVVDASRGTGARGGRPALDSRTVPVTVRYPIVGDPGAEEATDAPPAGSWPLVVFAHGFDVSQSTYAALLHDLAAAGFVVAAPDFPLSTSDQAGPAVEGDEGQQALDVSLVIDRLTDGSTAPSLAAAVRPGPVGLVGHSDGAVTVLLAGYSPDYADPRVGAVVDVSGAYDDFGGPWFSTQDPPLLSLHGGADELNPLSADRALVAADPGEAELVVVDGASHLGAVTGPSEGALARLVADDLAWRLTGAPGGPDAVAGDEAVAPLQVELERGD